MPTAEENQKNDLKVVEFFNSTDFDFTPELGAMYNGQPLSVNSGQKKFFPYHTGKQLALNLAKAVLIKGAPAHNPTDNNPTGTPLWSEQRLQALADSFIIGGFMDEKPASLTENERLVQRIADLEKLFQKSEAEKPLDAPRPEVKSVSELVNTDFTKPEAQAQSLAQAKGETTTPKVYQDKQEVIAELEKRGIQHDKRASKANLEKLLS